MDIRQLEAFVQVVQHHSFTKAAKALFCSQPTVSGYIASLERELGVKLVNRRANGATPSQRGEILFQYACDILTMRDNAVLHCTANVPRECSIGRLSQANI